MLGPQISKIEKCVFLVKFRHFRRFGIVQLKQPSKKWLFMVERPFVRVTNNHVMVINHLPTRMILQAGKSNWNHHYTPKNQHFEPKNEALDDAFSFSNRWFSIHVSLLECKKMCCLGYQDPFLCNQVALPSPSLCWICNDNGWSCACHHARRVCLPLTRPQVSEENLLQYESCPRSPQTLKEVVFTKDYCFRREF